MESIGHFMEDLFFFGARVPIKMIFGHKYLLLDYGKIMGY